MKRFIRKFFFALVAILLFLAACTGAPGRLPATLYFLDGPYEEAQVWRMERDGITKDQITDESAGVDAFAVSPADGTLAFVSGNQLFLVDGNGENRRLIADGSQLDSAVEDAYFHNTVDAPVFSPDGRTLAYAFDGLHLYDLASGEDQHVLTNLGNLLGESFVFAKEAYTPGPWSPDGSRLLIIMGYYEGSTLAVMEPGAEQPFTRLRSDGPVCCLFSWTEDSRSVLVANPYFTTDLPGMWSYDARTGERTVLVPGLPEDGTNHYVGWPQQLTSGELIFFYSNLERFLPDEGIPLVMVRSDPDGSNLAEVRSEEFRVSEVLWAPDGSLALIQGSCCGGGRQVILIRSDASPLEVLIEDGEQIRGMAWGP